MRINILSKPKSFQIFIAKRPLRETGAAFLFFALRAEGGAPGYKYGTPLGRNRSVFFSSSPFQGRGWEGVMVGQRINNLPQHLLAAKNYYPIEIEFVKAL
jgi:hypothetical protein